YSSLNPRMTVGEIIGEGLRLHQNISGKEARDEIAQWLEQVGLHPDHMSRYPHEFSGGQRQRVAIGRAIVRNPKVFLFDEPLSNLDASLRMDMRMEIGKLHQSLNASMIYVTHDQVEAMTLADKIVVLNDGKVMQSGSPMELYKEPANMFVASFLGAPSMNFLNVEVQEI
ncbi:MAG: ABC transporter ATP-binding protein, partial [Pseudomonadota bacterium]|nr:ABC transporter ATP-binding protein [Pseudomonadota bacterium]